MSKDLKPSRSEFTLSILGTFNATLDGKPLNKFRTKKVQALLIYLAIENSPARRDFLMELLWPGLPQQSAQVSLRQTLYQLRLAVPNLPARDGQASVPIVLSDRETIQIHPDGRYQFDLHDFSSLFQKGMAFWPEAINLYRGDFLEDFYLSDSAPFTDWIQSHRAHLRRQVLDVLNKLTEAAMTAEQLDKAEQYARRQLEIDNLSEAAHRQLMMILANLDQRVEALAQYDSLRQLLLDELDIEPSATTQALAASIRAGTVAAVSQPIQDADAHRNLPPFLEGADNRASTSDTAFIANQSHLTKLDESLAQAVSGQGQMVFITGGPGWGKSTLMEAFALRAQAAHPDLVVAMGRCAGFAGTGDPYLPFREIMEQLGGDIESRWRANIIGREQAQRLWQTMPRLAQLLSQMGQDLLDIFLPGDALVDRVKAAVVSHPDWLTLLQIICERRWQTATDITQTNLFQQFTNVLTGLSQHTPLLLLLDDLHWIDEASTGLLFHLGRYLAGMRIFIVGGFRPDYVAEKKRGERHPLAAVLNESKRQFGDIVIALEESPALERQAFVSAFLDNHPNQLSATFYRDFFQFTGGHPLFTFELWRELQQNQAVFLNEQEQWEAHDRLEWDRLPPRAEGVIAEQTARLPEVLREILTIASVEGESFTAQVIAQVQQTHTQEVVRAISRELLQTHHLVLEQSTKQVRGQHLFRFRFRHQLFQHYLYQQLSQSERSLLHGEIGVTLESVYGDQAHTIAPHLASHFSQAGHIDKARHYLQLAGEQASASYAHEEAIRFLTLALQFTPVDQIQERFNLLSMREKLYDLQGNRDAQLQDLEHMVNFATNLSFTEETIVSLRQANFAEKTSNYEQAIIHAQGTVDLAKKEGNIYLLAEAYNIWGRSLWRLGAYAPAKEQWQTGLEVSQHIGNLHLEANCEHGLGTIALQQGEYPVAERHFLQDLTIRQRVGDLIGEAASLNSLMVVAWVQGKYENSKRYIAQSLSIRSDIGDRLGESASLNNLGVIANLQGDYSNATRYHQQSLVIRREISDRRGEGASLNNLGCVAKNQMDFSRAIKYHKQALAIRREVGDRDGEGEILHELGAAALGQLDFQLAESYFEKAQLLRTELNQPHYLAEDKAGLAKAKLLLGNTGSAKQFVRYVLRYLKENPQLKGTANPIRTFHFTWDVLVALGQNIDADQVLTLATYVIQDYLDKNSDRELQAMYLSQPHHQVLWTAWQESREVDKNL